jgi:hypothetical protein
MTEDICAKYKADFAMHGDEPDHVRSTDLQQHGENCANCRVWTKQMNSIVNDIGQIPQFDVSEALTQKVLAGITQERKSHAIKEWIVLPASLIVCAAVCFVAPLDSVEGACSWLMCAAVAAAFGVIVRGPAKSLKLEVRS